MSRPSKAQFDAVIRSMDGLKAYAKLKSMGYDVSQRECREARVAFTGKGYKQTKRTEPVEAERATQASAEMASKALLKAQLRTGQHWITDAGQFARACESVGLPA